MSEASEKQEAAPNVPVLGGSPAEGSRGEGGEESSENGGGAGAVGVLDATPPSALSPVAEEPAGDTKKKIDVLLKAVGDTPIMKTKKWTVERTRTIQSLIDFIKKFLKLLASEQLFIYVNQSFAPSPDQEVGTLYEVTTSLQNYFCLLCVLEAMANLYYIIVNLRPGDELIATVA